MIIISLKTSIISLFPKKSIFIWIEQSLRKKNQTFHNGDILVLSSKIVSYFEGRLVKLSDVKVSAKAKIWAKKMNADPALIQLAINEADSVIAVTPWVLLTRKNGIYCANAGVDKSNVPKGYAITWPNDPFNSAQVIRKKLMKKCRLKKFAVLIIDSVCQPGRKGTTAIAIGFSGIQGWQNLKGKKDLYGNVLRYSALNIVDSLATTANLVMGESNECCPIAVIRDYQWKRPFFAKASKGSMVISPRDEMFPIG